MRKKRLVIYALSIYFLGLFIELCPISCILPVQNIGIVFADEKTDVKKKDNTKKTAEKVEKKESSADELGEDFFNYKRPEVKEQSTFGMIVKLVLVIGLMVAGFYFFFKFVTKKTGIQKFGDGVLKTLAVVPIGQNKYIQIVDLAGKVLILGVCENSITTLDEITERDEIDRIRLLSSKTTPVEEKNFQKYFQDKLTDVFTKGGDVFSKKVNGFGGKKKQNPVDNLSYMQKQKDRLKKMNRFDDHE